MMKKTLLKLFLVLTVLTLGLPTSTAIAAEDEPTLFVSVTSIYISDLTSRTVEMFEVWDQLGP